MPLAEVLGRQERFVQAYVLVINLSHFGSRVLHMTRRASNISSIREQPISPGFVPSVIEKNRPLEGGFLFNHNNKKRKPNER